jgi:hypothetical protein
MNGLDTYEIPVVFQGGVDNAFNGEAQLNNPPGGGM